MAEIRDVGRLEDPFTGEPIRYSVEDGGFICYSLGQNKTDDSGLRDYKNGDVVWSTGLPWRDAP